LIILLTSGDSLTGGAGTYARALESQVSSLRVASCDKNLGDYHIPNFNSIPGISAFFAVIKLIREKQASAIVCQSTGALLISIFLRPLFPRLPIITIYHGLASGYEGSYLRLLEVISALFATKIVVTNLSDGAKIFSKGKQVYIPNCSTRVGISGCIDRNGPLVSVTRWGRQKNNAMLREFFEISDVDFQIYSKESDHEFFRDIFRSDKQVCFYSSSKYEIYEHKSIFVLSTYSEGFPLSILEAASIGLPIVVSKIDILVNILGTKVQYFSSAEELKEITDKLRYDKAHYNEWSISSLSLSKQYSLERWVANWVALLDIQSEHLVSD
tara:strand:+ start:116 stop:1096 length:981 start_codon:yes stop_codon:yes gene_type:complete